MIISIHFFRRGKNGWKGKGGIEHSRNRGPQEREYGNQHVSDLHKRLLGLNYPLCNLKDGDHWFDRYDKLPDLVRVCLDGRESEEMKKTEDKLRAWETIAETVFSKEAEVWTARQAKHATGEDKWLAGIEQKGTLNDRISSMALRCQESPMHRISSLFGLLDLAEKRERQSSQAAIEALKDLFINNLLPDGRLLVPLTIRPVNRVVELPILVAAQALALWYYEDRLRLAVKRVLTVLQRLSSDTVVVVKKSAIDTSLELLSAKPEGEGFLLSIIVNKLGDPERSSSSHAHHSLLQLLKRHPTMKGVVIREIHQLLHRQRLPPKGLYAGISVLSHVFLVRGKDEDIATDMVKIYFELFERAINAGDLKTRLLGAILTGVKRALPYMGPENSRMKALHGYTDQLFRLVHDGGFTTATQAMSLLWRMVLLENDDSGGNSNCSLRLASRYYSALYSKLLSSDFRMGSRLTEFLNLVFQSIKYDTNRGRITAICKRLLQIAAFSSPPLCSAALLIVSEALKKHQYLREPLLTGEREGRRGDNSSSTPVYDPTKRNPMYACGGIEYEKEGGLTPQYESSSSVTPLPPLWEVSLLRFHYHPSVSKFAEKLLTPPGHGITYHGDPLQDMTLSSFLDKIAFRNPKKYVKMTKKGEDRQGEGRKSLQYSGSVEKFASVPLEMVRPDEVFFHRFFRERERRDDAGLSRRRRKKGLKANQDNGKLGNVITEGTGDAGEEDGEIDVFADKLAEGIMRSAGDNFEEGDIGDWDGPEGTDTEDEGGSNSDSDSESAAKRESNDTIATNFSAQSRAGKEFGNIDENELSDTDDLSSSIVGCGDADGFMDNDSSSDADKEEQQHGKKRGTSRSKVLDQLQAKKLKRKKSQNEFVAVEDYEDVLNQFNPDALNDSSQGSGGSDLPRHNLKGGRAKKRRRIRQK